MKKVLALAVATAFLLAGCSTSRYLSLHPNEIDEPVCADVAPMAVQNLKTDRLDCNLSGTTLIFPDGTELETSEFGGAGSQSDSDSPWTYGWHSVGDLGMVATQSTETCDDVEVWGPPAAADRLRNAFGETWPCGE